MRKIGLIGGMSYEGSAVYYRSLNQGINKRLGGLHSAQVLLHSVDFQAIVDKQKAGEWEQAGHQLAEVAKNLEKAGADCVMICAVTMHLVSETVIAATPLPFIHIVDVVAERLKSAGHRKPLLVATRYTMENGFYPARMEKHGIEVMVPDAEDRGQIHDIIFNELSLGIARCFGVADREGESRGCRLHHLRMHGDLPDPRDRQASTSRFRLHGHPRRGRHRVRPGQVI